MKQVLTALIYIYVMEPDIRHSNFANISMHSYHSIIYRMITNDVSDYINLLVRIAYIIWNRAIHYKVHITNSVQKLIVTQVVKKLPAFYGIRRFISVHKSTPLVPIQSQMNPHYLRT